MWRVTIKRDLEDSVGSQRTSHGKIAGGIGRRETKEQRRVGLRREVAGHEQSVGADDATANNHISVNVPTAEKGGVGSDVQLIRHAKLDALQQFEVQRSACAGQTHTVYGCRCADRHRLS